jgi:uncharacterized protein (TIGR03435 family)
MTTRLAMVRRLVAERFNLEAHLEQEERRVLVLNRASPTAIGPALRALPKGCARLEATFPEDVTPADAGLPRCMWFPANGTLTATGTFRDFARHIGNSMQREVVDETGLTGVYTFTTAFDPETLLRLPLAISRSSPSGRYSELPSFKTILKDDLGLVLQEATRPVPVLVITHVEPLRAN